MKQIIYILFFITSLPVFAQDSLTTKDLQGVWKLMGVLSANSPLLNPDTPFTSDHSWSEPNLHWVISNDRVYEIDYPCCLKNSFQFVTFKDGIFLVPDSTKHFQHSGYSVTLKKDSLIVVDFFQFGSTYYFTKDILSTKTVSALKNEWINPKCLYGDWEIPVGEVSVPYDAIVVWYPFTLPETIHIDAGNIHKFFANNRFYLEVDGVKRSFKVGSVSLHDEDLMLYPEEWVEEYLVKHNLEPYQVSDVWLRKTED